jgi:predicted transposase YdaD
MPTPHDKLFKVAFAEPEALRVLLRLALPAHQATLLEGAALRLLDPVLPADPSERRVDLLAELTLDDRTYTLDFLFEHQSHLDRAMGVRILGSMVARWSQWTRQNPPGAELQRIIAVVVYHGPVPWTDPLAFHERFGRPGDDPHPFDAFQPDFRYLLVDLGDPKHQPAKGPVFTLLATALLSRWSRIQRGGGGTLVDELRACAHLVRRLVTERDQTAFGAIVEYILHVEETATEEEVHTTLRAITQDQEVNVPTIAERIEQRGIEKGKAEGIARGKAEGFREALLSAATSAFGPCPARLLARFQQADEAALLGALQRLRTANGWEQLLA